MKLEISCLVNEYWWGGAVGDGIRMPFGKQDVERDLNTWVLNNQSSASLMSNMGRYVYSKEPFRFQFHGGLLTVEGEDLISGQAGQTLQSARQYLVENVYSPDGKLPHKDMFSKIQYNTWIQMNYEPSQEKVLAYAQSILDHGYPAGILMLDDCWNQDYGVWEFDALRFPDPKSMMEKLHGMGFSVMLWTCPFVSPDSRQFRYLESKDLLIKNADGETYITKWWNGYSAVLDLTNEGAVAWYVEQADRLVREYGVDGFKMDAGDPEFYPESCVFHKPMRGAWQSHLWAEIGSRYPMNELRSCFGQECRGIAQRMQDKNHEWGEGGMGALIPNGIVMGLVGYSYLCPDMVGGGMWGDFASPDFSLDQELFVRYAQCAALMPMIQFSLAPWQALDGKHAEICRQVLQIREKYLDTILNLAEQCRMISQPIIRPLCYNYPNEGLEEITDQFLLGENIIVAPVVEKNARTRTVHLPRGSWRGADGKLYSGGVWEVDAPLDFLPIFTKENS